jgi:TRAP-type C4-dicarboxylate transport system permease small subunit
MLVMTIIIPYGVFMRYVVNAPASWPEPAGVLLMVVFSFIGGAAAYRAKAHIAVSTFLNMMGDKNRARTEFVAELGMALVALFMIKWGVQLVRLVWHNSIAEFPDLSAGVTYLPIPVAGGRDAALRDRARLVRRAAGHVVHVPRPAPGGIARRHHGCRRPPPDLPPLHGDRHAGRLRDGARDPGHRPVIDIRSKRSC